MCGIKIMHSMEEQFNEENCIDTLRILSGDKNLAEMPHSDTLNFYMIRLLWSQDVDNFPEMMAEMLLTQKSQLFGRDGVMGY